MAKSDLKERLRKKKEELKTKGGDFDMIFIKEGTIRARLLPVEEDADFVLEVTQFYLGGDIKGVISPSTFDEPCAIMEAYKELKESDDPDDKEMAKGFVPRKKYLSFVIAFEDLKGKTVDKDRTEKLILLTAGLFDKLIDLYLDDDEWGDMMDKEDGYDIKFTRTGTGKTDTEYTLSPCKNTPLKKEFHKRTYDLEEEVRKIMPTYEKTQEYIAMYLGIAGGDTDDEESKAKTKKKKKKKSKKSDD